MTWKKPMPKPDMRPFLVPKSRASPKCDEYLKQKKGILTLNPSLWLDIGWLLCSNTHLAQLQHFFDNTSTPTRIIYISSSIFVFFLAIKYLNLGLIRSESPWILKCKQLQFNAVK